MTAVQRLRPLFAVLCAALVFASRARAASVSDWRADIDAIVGDIRLLHPDPFTVTGRTSFLREAEALKRALPGLSEEQRVVRAMRLVASIGDGHTFLEPTGAPFRAWYPIRLQEFSDGIFVTCAHRSVADLAGAQVLEIAGHPAREVVDAARDLMGADNVFGRLDRLSAVHSAGLMRGLGYADASGALAVRVRRSDGRIETRTLRPTPTDRPHSGTFEWRFRSEVFGLPFDSDSAWVSAFRRLPSSAFLTADTTRPVHLIDRRPQFARALPGEDAFYIRSNQVGDDFLALFRDALPQIDRQRPRRLIIDLRYNIGGDGSVLTRVIDEFIRRKDAPPWNELYVLTGRRTFSAAVMALDQFLDHTRCTLVGEPAGSALNHFGDPITRDYAHTGLTLHVSTLRHQLSSSDDLATTIPVDVPAPFSFADYAAGRDPAVDPILRGEEMRSVAIVALAEGGAAARRVWEERKNRYAGVPWWEPPKEIDLRFAAQALRDQKRLDEAIEVCRLSTEIHPYDWHAWLNLGLALRASGKKREGLACYRCLLAIDPDNYNRDDLRALLAKEDPGDTVAVAATCPIRR